MKVQIKRIDPELPLPVYEKSGSIGFDLCSRVDMTIGPGQISLVPANVIVQTPPGYMLVLACRSSTPKKKGLTMPHGFGVIDQDYCGPEDELLLQMKNFTDELVAIERGEKIAQGIFVRADQLEWEEVDHIEAATRGGFGSSGGYHPS
jgi:dUTP pyrophosphatase